MMKPKFKIGDKVRILPPATYEGISEAEVGTIQTILKILEPTIIVITDSNNPDGEWWINPCNMELTSEVGEQLVFEFML